MVGRGRDLPAQRHRLGTGHPVERQVVLVGFGELGHLAQDILHDEVVPFLVDRVALAVHRQAPLLRNEEQTHPARLAKSPGRAVGGSRRCWRAVLWLRSKAGFHPA
jgi:hypothetical protein